MTRLSLSALALALSMPAAANAATVAQYTPGGAPCNGACTQEWAQSEWGVPGGEAVPMIVPQGSYIERMSYAKAAVPYWYAAPAVFASDEPAIGYPLGDGRWMVRIASCQNWAIVTMPGRTTAMIAPMPYAPIYAPPAGRTYPAMGGYGYGGYGPGGYAATSSVFAPVYSHIVTVDIDAPHKPDTPPETVPPVPLPATAFLLVLALSTLTFLRRKQ